MIIGILGLPYSGKTTLFEAITGAHGAAMDRSGSAHTATVAVPDERLDRLAEMNSPKKITPAHIDFIDVAGVRAEDGRERTAATLAPLRDADGLLHVVRKFEWPSAPPHPHGSLDPKRDVEEMSTDLIVADLEIVERRIQKLEKQVHKPTPHQEQDKKELALMQRVKEALDAGRHVTDLGLTAEDARLVRNFQLLSDKPIVPVLNVHEDELDSEGTHSALEAIGPGAIAISAKLEKEISELEPEERQEFVEGMGLGEPAARRVIQACYARLGLRSFFTGTGAGEELRAWTLQAGDSALVAAGKIHTDIQRGFIRAEVVAYDDLVEAGGMTEAKAANKVRLEGKEYEVQDGDVILFRFKV